MFKNLYVNVFFVTFWPLMLVSTIYHAPFALSLITVTAFFTIASSYLFYRKYIRRYARTPKVMLARISTIIVFVFIFALTAPNVFAHSWYPHKCCSDRDCYPVKAKDVRRMSNGWMIEGRFYDHSELRPSPDDDFHVCRREDGKGEIITPFEEKPCVWAPVEGS